MVKVYESKAYMHMLYKEKKMSPDEIALKLNVSRATIYRALKKHGFIK